MTRQTAYNILLKYLTNQILVKHSLAAEAVMRKLAARFGDKVEDWGIVGLLHDADYEKSKDHPEKHGLLLAKLEPNSIPSEIEHSINAHNFEFTHIQPESKMDWAIVCCDELTGIIYELASSSGEKKLANITPELVLSKLNDKNFVKKTNGKNIFLCEEKLGIPLPEFVALTLYSMQTIATELGL